MLADDRIRFQLLSIGGAEGTFVVDDRGRVLAVNQRAAQLIGREAADLISAPLEAFLAPKSAAEVRDRMTAGDPEPVDVTVVPATGTTFFGEARATTVRIGRRAVTVVNILDTSKWQSPTVEIRNRDARIRTIFDQYPSGISFVSPELRTVEANETFCRMLGYSRDELLGMAIRETDYAPDADLDAKLAELLVSRAIIQYTLEKRLVRKDGAIVPTRITASPLIDRDDDAPLGRLVIIDDLTEERRLEEELEEARAQLEPGAERRMSPRNTYGLTARERNVLSGIVSGRTDREIAVGLHISRHTVQKHVANLLAKMRASSRTEAAVRALRERLVR